MILGLIVLLIINLTKKRQYNLYIAQCLIEQGAARESLDGYSKVLILFLQLFRLFIFHAEPQSDRLVSLSGLLQHLVQAVVRLVGLVLLARETAQQ